MYPDDDPYHESLLTLETRQIMMLCGRSESFTFPLLTWLAYDYVLDRGYCTHEQLITHANQEGWVRDDLPFEDRFSSVIAYWQRRMKFQHADWQAYAQGAR